MESISPLSTCIQSHFRLIEPAVYTQHIPLSIGMIEWVALTLIACQWPQFYSSANLHWLIVLISSFSECIKPILAILHYYNINWTPRGFYTILVILLTHSFWSLNIRTALIGTLPYRFRTEFLFPPLYHYLDPIEATERVAFLFGFSLNH